MNKLQEVGEKCAEETNATDDDVAALIAHTMPESHNGKCMILCFNVAFHLQKPDGTPDKEGSIASLEPLKADDPEMHAKVLKIFMTCGQKTAVDADPCMTAAHLAECATLEGKAAGLSADMFEV
ncbi:general odorant-binding protein 19d isoform X2 [Aethina tumida]|nr:general odorant-binding protein 19d isoform X2 [Aethina tumida]XP_049825313.1 general odorant-binding protein 19d isoform X2 [Aethina tumida]XP_049825314.1 general odorant-binding protein 19d isoform X2 [Aethina tumida]XP_049825315.1 general odorant-binding protein 19d isoform X2 [Aethina tumida]